MAVLRNSVYLFVCAICILAGSSSAQSFQECLNVYMNDVKTIQSVNEICAPLERYLVCALRSFNLEGALTPAVVEQMENEMQKQLSQAGISCNIDMNALVQSIRDGSAPTSRPVVNTGSGNSDMDQFQRCMNVYMDALQGITNNQQICGPLRNFMICTFKSFGIQIDGVLSQQQRSQLQAQLDAQLSKIGVDCGFSIDSLARDLRNGGNGASSVKTSFCGLMLGLFSVVMMLMRRQLF
ncbi:uncharacterized protein LOC101858410 [Aplysia californica]|uniref:Uncharacterized protein LOC101858410 n=1 Tax=Aplysia californica TaxID=6500 RepID=A0ABM0JQH9_APLCA|nr:uncharacterized protein LOC101858410 [Aplysia californica]